MTRCATLFTASYATTSRFSSRWDRVTSLMATDLKCGEFLSLGWGLQQLELMVFFIAHGITDIWGKMPRVYNIKYWTSQCTYWSLLRFLFHKWIHNRVSIDNHVTPHIRGTIDVMLTRQVVDHFQWDGKLVYSVLTSRGVLPPPCQSVWQSACP